MGKLTGTACSAEREPMVIGGALGPAAPVFGSERRRANAHKHGHGPELSAIERAQLGTVRCRRDGTPASHPWPDARTWPALREYLLKRSRSANPQLDEALTAYTPGETVALLNHPVIRDWHAGPAVQPLDERFTRLVFVPCAKTKPWTGPATRKSKLYSAYNTLRDELPDTCFVTISEPLGIVPMHRWADFPQYDNPGLFRDDAQRSGMTRQQWLASPFATCYGVPFDDQARGQALDRLGAVIAQFLDVHRDRELVAFVDDRSGVPTTHGEMLDRALASAVGDGVQIDRWAKRGQARVSPLPYLRDALSR